MKKYIRPLLIVLVIGTLTGVPIFISCTDPPEDITAVEESPAKFTFKGNPQVSSGQEVKFEIKVTGKNVAKVLLKYDDEVIRTWKNPTGTLSHSFKTSLVGSRRLEAHTTTKDGKTFEDNRVLRVVAKSAPKMLKAERVDSYSHEVSSFTQGLEFYQGKLFESTGLNGKSKIVEVDLISGIQSKERTLALDATYFGEGITILNDIIYQLTWTSGKCFMYDLKDHIALRSEFNYSGQGWGICNDGTSLIMSDGSESIYFRNPSTFAIEKTIEVYTNLGAVTELNELEYIDGLIYANVWRRDQIVVIDPETGVVIQVIDCADVGSEGRGGIGEVMNGIAHNPADGKTYVTGKNWPRLLEVKFVE